MINYGSIEREPVLPNPATEKRQRRRRETLRQLGLCVSCGQVPVKRFARCLQCRLKNRPPCRS